jgi:hypothetical protein
VELTGGRDGTTTTFRIPPLSSESKTLALLSANAMFRASAREAAKLSATQWQGSQTCVDYLATLDAQPVYTHMTEQRSKHKAAPMMVTALEMFAVLITENMARLVEATRALAGNQQNVGAAGLSKSPDQADAQDDLWNGPLNSQTAALRVLLGDPAKKLELLGCRTELYRSTHRKALNLLRVARLSDAYRTEDDVDTDSLVRQMICVFAQDRQENDPEYVLPEGCPDSLGSMPVDVVDSFYRAQDIGEADVAVARRYLAEEELALDLLIRDEPGTDPVRVYSSTPSTGVRPAAYYVGKALGAQRIMSTSEDEAFLQYSERGTLPAIDYLRRVAEKLLAAESNGTDRFSPDQEQLLVGASVLARSVVGPERIVVTPVEANGNGGKDTGRGITEGPIVGGENFDTVEVELYGASESDLDRILFLNGKTGYRCLFEGNLGGKACDYSDYLINPTLAEYFRPTNSTVGPLEHGLRFHIRENIRHWSEAFSEIYIVKASASGNPKLLGLFDFTSVDPSDLGPHVPNPRLIIPVVRDSEADSIVRSIVQRQPGNCGEPSEMCGDLGIRRNYIPTHENELIEDADPYPNSWNHYLILARQAADHADALGEQLVQAGLDMDLRAEQAQRELEAICGGVFNFDPVQANGCDVNDQSCDAVSQYIEDNPALQSCLPESMGG